MVGEGALRAQVVRLADRVRGFAVAADARRHARVVQTVPLGPGSRLLVVEFGGRRLLIGQARGGLLRLDASEAEA